MYYCWKEIRIALCLKILNGGVVRLKLLSAVSFQYFIQTLEVLCTQQQQQNTDCIIIVCLLACIVIVFVGKLSRTYVLLRSYVYTFIRYSHTVWFMHTQTLNKCYGTHREPHYLYWDSKISARTRNNKAIAKLLIPNTIDITMVKVREKDSRRKEPSALSHSPNNNAQTLRCV